MCSNILSNPGTYYIQDSSREATPRCSSLLSQTLLLDPFLLIYPQTVPQNLDNKETANSPQTRPTFPYLFFSVS